MKIKKAHLLFEQSGTFKREFLALGIPAFDYDIQNDFGETDFKIDLFAEIEKAFDGKESIFDTFTPDDLIFAFFPCVRFENQIMLFFRGQANQQKDYTIEQKMLGLIFVVLIGGFWRRLSDSNRRSVGGSNDGCRFEPPFARRVWRRLPDSNRRSQGQSLPN